MEAVGNLARIIEENRRHARAIVAVLDLDLPDICTECGRPFNPAAVEHPDLIKCRHQGGTDDCPSSCIMIHGSAYRTEVYPVQPEQGGRPEWVKSVTERQS